VTMRRGLLALAAVLAAGLAILSKPADSGLDAHIQARALAEVKRARAAKDDGVLGEIMSLACKLAPEECARQLVKLGTSTRIEDFFVLKRATVTIDDQPALRCYGLLNTWRCSELAVVSTPR